MSIVAEKLMSDALELPNEERAFLAEKLFESLAPQTDEPLSPEWREEIRRRRREIDQGRAVFTDASEVFAAARRKFG